MVGLNWTRFWPTLLDLGAMEHMLVEGPPEAIPLLTETLVRIPWLQVIQVGSVHCCGVSTPDDYASMLSRITLAPTRTTRRCAQGVPFVAPLHHRTMRTPTSQLRGKH